MDETDRKKQRTSNTYFTLVSSAVLIGLLCWMVVFEQTPKPATQSLLLTVSILAIINLITEVVKFKRSQT